MEKPPLTVAASLTVKDAIAMLNQGQIGCLLVVEQRQILGIVTAQDLVRCLATQKDWTQTPVSEVMNQTFRTLSLATFDLGSQLTLLQDQPTEYLPVVTQQGEILGIVTLGKLLKALQEVVTSRPQQTLPQEPLENILSALEDVVWSIDTATSRLTYINPAAVYVYGRTIAELTQNTDYWQDIVHPHDKERVEQAYQALYSSGRQDLEYRVVWPDGQIHWVHSRARLITDASGAPYRVYGITSNITDRYQILEQLRRDALYDGLTGLANRSLLKDRLEQAFNRNQRQTNKCFALLFLDLDRFKEINDTLGHHVGDRLLVKVAERLQRCQRSGDTVARLGGDEFVILLESLNNPDDALKVADRIHQALAFPILIESHEIVVTTSIGITVGSVQNQISLDWATQLLRNADTAMYRAKCRGQGNSEVFQPAMSAAAPNLQVQMEADLYRAVSNIDPDRGESSEFILYYQPIVSLLDQHIQGFEALVRWKHPEKGLLSPDMFIPSAEKLGLIISIERYVVRQACQQLCFLRSRFPHLPAATMSINLSGKHFTQTGLLPLLDQVLEETGLDGSALRLEITETNFTQNFEAATLILRELRNRQIQICLDDFGMGYSSLKYLDAVPLNSLKIDRSFVRELPSRINGNDRPQLVQAIVYLGLSLGLTVVAKGIETQEQVLQLQTFNCQAGQGYWFAPPMSCDNLLAFLSAS